MKIKAYLELTKPKIVQMVIVTYAMGYFLAKRNFYPLDEFLMSLFASALVCAGVSTLNQVVECREDALMKRTRQRPLPLKIISLSMAFFFGVGLITVGIAILYLYISALLSVLAFLTALLYIVVYTPLKKITWLNTTIGAIPGALPPFAGYALANGSIDLNAWILFFILFFWQHSHFYAIAWVCKSDYKNAGFRMITENDSMGFRTFMHTFFHSLFLFLSTFILFYTSEMSLFYAISIVILSIWFSYKCFKVLKNISERTASRLILDSVIYLPLFTIIIFLDTITL